jgi:Domain of unknown function (DUF4406)
MRLYLAGPMSGIEQFNFPAFYEAAATLREAGHDIVSPAEMDATDGIDEEAMSSTDGDANKLSMTWAQLLARDVLLIGDETDNKVDGIVFLPGWIASRGARLEAFTALLSRKYHFYDYARETGSMMQIHVNDLRQMLRENMP